LARGVAGHFHAPIREEIHFVTNEPIDLDQLPASPPEMAHTPDELLTVPQVMARLQLSRSAVYDLLRTRRLASISLGRARRIPAHALTDLIRTHLDQEVA
jgi:excisionase family DNA binding protein